MKRRHGCLTINLHQVFFINEALKLFPIDQRKVPHLVFIHQSEHLFSRVFGPHKWEA